MTKSELIGRLAARLGLKPVDAKIATNEILNEVSGTLTKNGRVEIRDFGVFTLNYHASRIGRNPMSGEKVMVPAKRVLHFKASKALRELVDGSREQYPLIADDRSDDENPDD